jgi:hypothetical protein
LFCAGQLVTNCTAIQVHPLLLVSVGQCQTEKNPEGSRARQTRTWRGAHLGEFLRTKSLPGVAQYVHRRIADVKTPTHAPSNSLLSKLYTSLKRISTRRSPTRSRANSQCPPLSVGAASQDCRFVRLAADKKSKSSCTMNCPVSRLPSERRCGGFVCSVVDRGSFNLLRTPFVFQCPDGYVKFFATLPCPDGYAKFSVPKLLRQQERNARVEATFPLERWHDTNVLLAGAKQ